MGAANSGVKADSPAPLALALYFATSSGLGSKGSCTEWSAK